MRVSTSTNICTHVLWNWEKEFYTSAQAIQMIAQGGFGAVDLDLSFWRIQEDCMARDDWKVWLEEQIRTAQEVKIPITQTHAHFFGLDHCELLTEQEQEHRIHLIQRDIEASAMCGASWVVVHPQSYSGSEGYDPELSMAKNCELFKRLGETAAKHGVCLAIENMFIHAGVSTCFAADEDELIALVDTLGDYNVFGICWDTGHAYMNKLDQATAVRKMGKRLKALHVNDNRNQGDDHVLPYHGFISWEPFMKALGEVDYQGDFTYEIHNFTKGFDAEFHQEALTFSRKLGEHMLTLM